MKHLVKITLRRLSKEKVYAIINIIGLSIGMASALLILLFIRFETTYDTYHTDHERIYRVGSDFKIQDHRDGYAVSSAALAPMLTNEFEEIESFLRILYLPFFLNDLVFQYNGQRLSDDAMFAVDSTFFDFFSCTFIGGGKKNALNKPFSMVVTRSFAERYFGHTDIVGERVLLKDSDSFTITAVTEDPPLNSHFRYNFLISLATAAKMERFFSNAFMPGINWETFENNPGSFIVWSYIKVAKDLDFEAFLKDNDSMFNLNQNSNQAEQVKINPVFQRFASIHLDSDLLYELSSETIIARMMNRQMVLAFFIIAFFILIVASINSANIAISHFNKRKKEMVIMKILGSGSKRLFSGFFTESLITSLTGLLFALLILEVIMSPVNNLLLVNLSLNILTDGFTVAILVVVLLVSAFLSGIFPALYYYQTPYISLMGNRFRFGKKSLIITKILMMVQFTIATLMIITALNIQRHFKSMQDADWGFSPGNIAAFVLHDRENKINYKLLEDILLADPRVEKTAKTNYMITTWPIKHSTLFLTERGDIFRSFYNISTSKSYLDLMGIKQSGGGDIPDNFDDQYGVLVNKALVDSTGFIDPVGRQITTHFQFLGGRLRKDRVITGVTEDFHYTLFNEPVQPLVVLPMGSETARYVAVKFNDIRKEEQIEIMEEAWGVFEHQHKADFFFIEDNVEAFNAQQRSLAKFFGYFAYMCIVISFLGVFGITAINISQRKKEISIHKILGATEGNIFVLLFRFYFWFFISGLILGILISWQILKIWLDEFAWSAPLTAWNFVPGSLLVVLSVFLALGIHLLKIGSLNPAPDLRKD